MNVPQVALVNTFDAYVPPGPIETISQWLASLASQIAEFFADNWKLLKEFVSEHRHALLLILLVILVVVLVVFASTILATIGFGLGGVVAGSLAALAQSVLFGANVAAGSIFAILQSLGATGALVLTNPVIFAVVAVGIILCVLIVHFVH